MKRAATRAVRHDHRRGQGRKPGWAYRWLDGIRAIGWRIGLSQRHGDGRPLELWCRLQRSVMSEPQRPPDRIEIEPRCASTEYWWVDDDACPLQQASHAEDLGTRHRGTSGRWRLDLLKSDANVEVIIYDHAMPGMSARNWGEPKSADYGRKLYRSSWRAAMPSSPNGRRAPG